MHMSSPKVFDGASYVRCPNCFDRAHRIKRRPVDRIFSLFSSVRRYCCYTCHWQGNLRDEDVLPFNRDVLRRATAAAAAAKPAVVQPRLALVPGAAAPEAPRRRALAVAGRGFGT
jgi:hypothetical protein